MGQLDSHISVSISVADAAVAKDSFDTIMIAAYHTHNGDLVREYTSLAGMVSDNFTTGEPAYLAAAAVFAQNPRVTKVKIGRRGNAPDQVIDLTPTIVDSTTYTVTIVEADGTSNACSITTGIGDSVEDWCDDMTAAIEALIPGLATDNTTKVTLDAGAAPNNYYSVTVSDTDDVAGIAPNIARADVTADSSAATDLGAILEADSGWYGLIVADAQDEINIKLIAAWAESNGKFYMTECADEEILAGTGVAHDLKESGYYKTWIHHTRKPGEYPTAALMGQMFAANPGSQTWAYQTLAGITVQNYTATQLANMIADNCNHYKSLAGISITYPGKMVQGRFADIVRGIDWFESEIQSNIYGKLANLSKVSMTDVGGAIVAGEIWAAIKKGQGYELIATDPVPTVTIPKISDVSATDKANRLLQDVEFSATLAGAIHTVTITGKVSV